MDTGVMLPDKLNTFFACFEDNTVLLSRLTNKDCAPLSFSMADVSKTFKLVNPRKVSGLDGIPSRVIRACADQLAGVFTDIFNRSLSQSVVPTCFKMATIVPVPNQEDKEKSNPILVVTYTWLADVNASVAKCLCF
jgi:hypothetical protein